MWSCLVARRGAERGFLLLQMSVWLNHCFLFCSDTGAALFSQPWLMSLTVRQIIRASYLLPPNFPSSNSLCGRGDGRNAHWLSSLQQIQMHAVNASTLTLSYLFSLYLSLHEIVIAIVENNVDLCCAVWGWNTRMPCRLSAKCVSSKEKNEPLAADTCNN